MRSFRLKILKWILKKFARLTVKKYKPGIIGITGSVGKTSTKEAIKAVLSSGRYLRAASGNFNNEIGLPLTILGDWQKTGGIFFWLKVFFNALKQLILKTNYPEILILEYGADRPGDIKYLLGIAKPHIAVITAVGEIPVHLEFYSGPEAVAREKARLIESLNVSDLAVLNADDEIVSGLKERTRAKVITFGFSEGAQIKISAFENQFDKKFPESAGIVFKLESGGSFVPVKIAGTFGRTAAYSAAAATCVGLIFSFNLVKIAEALSLNFRIPQGRMNLIKGVKDSFIIDSSYNASPLSTKTALETLGDLEVERKIAVLGDMLEIGKYSLEVHEAIGKLAGKVVDLLFTVGPRAKFIAEGAKKAGLGEENIFSFLIAEEAKKEVELKIKKGDLILIKGSRAVGLEKVVNEIKEIAPIV